MDGRIAALEQWLRSNGGYLHPAIQIVHNDDLGFHWRSTDEIAEGTRLSVIPHSMALSYLNAIVDDEHPVYKSARGRLTVENIGFFYLMAQYLNLETSFWKPYLETLPSPHQLTTPLWFDNEADAACLEGTDVWFSAMARKKVYEQYWHDGVKLLELAGVDIAPYSWDLFRWAVTVFTSRSFSSRAIMPQNSKYWTTYKSSNDGKRQTVLLDMSHSVSEDLDFPVLFPVQDIPNHHHDTKVDWSFDPGRFSIISAQSFARGVEVLNNYGPKANDELLLGYGFCIAENPNDKVLLSLKALPGELRQHVKLVLSGYFNEDGDWNVEKATFRIGRLIQTSLASPSQVFKHLPEALLELLLYNLRHERGLPFVFINKPLALLDTSNPKGRRYLPHIARMITQSLVAKLQKLQFVRLPRESDSDKQRYARIYRDSQLEILEANVAALKRFTRSLRPTHDVSNQPGLSKLGPCSLLLLEEALGVFVTECPNDFEDFMLGVQASTNSVDLPILIQAGWEEDIWILLLCAWLVVSKRGSGVAIPNWVSSFEAEYGDASEAKAKTGEETEVNDILNVAHHAAEARPESLWEDARWSTHLIAGWSAPILRYESMMMMIADHGSGVETPRLVLLVDDGTDPPGIPSMYPDIPPSSMDRT